MVLMPCQIRRFFMAWQYFGLIARRFKQQRQKGGRYHEHIGEARQYFREQGDYGPVNVDEKFVIGG